MGLAENYLSKIGALTGDEMKTALYQLLIPRYFWVLWNSESSQKLASSVVNYLFCESAEGELARFVAEQQSLIDSKARELATDEQLCRALTCAVYNYCYGQYVDSGGKVGYIFAPFIGFIRAIQEVISGRERPHFLDSFVVKVGTRGAEPLLKLLALGLYRPLPSTPDSNLMREEVSKFIQQTQGERLTNLDALEVLEVSGQIAAPIVAFSGKKTVTTGEATQIAFEDSIAMLRAGFEPMENMLKASLEPTAIEFAPHELFASAFRLAVAFLCYYVHIVVAARIKDQANRYSDSLQSAIARLCAGKFGLSAEPATVFGTIQGLIPQFFEKAWINTNSVGKDDCFGRILGDLSLTDNSHRYGFLVGSKNQPLGCAAPFMRALMRIQDVFSKVREGELVRAG